MAIREHDKGSGPKTAGPERLVFDSDQLEPQRRLAGYRDFNGPGAIPSEIGPAFLARISRWRLDRTVLHDRHLNDIVHERSAERAAADEMNHFIVHVVCSGHYEIDTGGGFEPVPEGAIALVDMSRGLRSRARGAHVITVSFALDLMLEVFGSTEGLHGKVSDAASSVLFTDFVRALTRRAPEMSSDMMSGAARALLALLQSAMQITAPRCELSSHDVARVSRLKRIIERSLGDPSFGADAVVAQSSLSRATLYRLFKPDGGLRAYIQRRRLDRVRVALSSPDERRPFAAIASAAGFLSEGHCSRQFLSTFGIRPGEYHAQIAAANHGVAERRLGYFMAELS